MDRAKFYDAVRSSVFGGKISESQKDGMENLLNVWFEEIAPTYGAPNVTDHLAYDLATCFHESGATMHPISENLNYSVDGLLKTFSRERISEADARKYGRTTAHAANQQAIANIIYGGAWGLKNLGNTKPNDGWDFRGVGICQATGRRNARFASDRLNALFGMGIDLEANPAQRGDMRVSALSLFIGCKEGWFTGKKLSDYLIPGNPDFVEARRVVNGTDKAETIAGYARAFKKAIQGAV